jgi:hypothetical protein
MDQSVNGIKSVLIFPNFSFIPNVGLSLFAYCYQSVTVIKLALH